MSTVPEIRIRELNDRPRRSEREYVLYWMVAFRRKRYNFALERAVEIARELKRPLLVFEALRCDYPWASDRLHRFVLEGMAANERRFESSAARYFPYVETTRGVGKGLLEALAERACAVVTDDFPAFFVPRMLAAAAKKLDVTLEAVDANGIVPLRATDRVFTVAHSFRRFLDKEILPYLRASPKEDPLARVDLPPLKVLPREITERWPLASHKLLNVDPAAIAALPIGTPDRIASSRRATSQTRATLAEWRSRLPRW